MRRFGPEWVEANLVVGSSEQDTFPQTKVSSPLPVMKSQVVLVGYKMSAMPSANWGNPLAESVMATLAAKSGPYSVVSSDSS